MHIMFVITGLGMGGAERQVCDLADCFANQGHKVTLVSLVGDTVNRPSSPIIELVELGMRKGPLGFIKAYRQARQIIQQLKPDVVHGHMVHANLFIRLLRLSTKIPRMICTAHSINEGGWARMLAYRLTDQMCDLTTNVSKEAVDAFIALGAAKPGRIITMYNGIDTEKFAFNEQSRIEKRNELGIAPDTLLLLAVGRLTAAKDYPNLLRAFSNLPTLYYNVSLAIIGIGDDEPALKNLAESFGLKHRVYFLGLRRNVHEWMSAADLFVLSSAWEGFGLVVAEAMACERIVVATNCGGVKEVVGDTGFLVPPRDSERLALAIDKALRLLPEDAISMGKAARKNVKARYSLSSVYERWLEIYNEGHNGRQNLKCDRG